METDSLKTAVNAGALAMVVRNASWKPSAADGVLRDLRYFEDKDEKEQGTRVDVKGSVTDATDASELTRDGVEKQAAATSTNDLVSCEYSVRALPDYPDPVPDKFLFGQPTIHGGFQLPEGYDWARVPRNAKVRGYGRSIDDRNPAADEEPEVHLTASFSVVQPIIAIFQATNAVWTLYKTSDDQLDQFGFAAFGLTVTPYLVMSIINFIAQYGIVVDIPEGDCPS
jgi:hypothetical protein